MIILGRRATQCALCPRIFYIRVYMNKEFQELKAVIGRFTGSAREVMKDRMRDNLIVRNGNKHVYTGSYTQKGRLFNINTCSEEELLMIDEDMTAIGI